MWANVSTVLNDGLLPNMQALIDFLLSEEGAFLGICVICLPLLGKLVRFFKKLF